MSIEIFRNIRRLNKIVLTLIRYGFGGFVSETKLIPFFSSVERVLVPGKKGKGLSIPVRIRLVLEELGPTFIKLGQIASTRADLLPPDWVDEFKKLQDMVPPVPFDDVLKAVESSLKAPISSTFASFDERPVASASIAQVHLAELKDGTKAAVKVKRPGIDRIIEADISVMYTVSRLIEKYLPSYRRYRPREVVAEFERVVHGELDMRVEGANIERFYNLFKGDPGVQIPKVYWRETSGEVLTMERIEGTPIDEVDKLRGKGIDVRKTAMKGIELFFKQVFEFGIFHADLHPGNIFIRDDGAIIYLDFGIIGRLDRNLRTYLARILFCLVREDYLRLAEVHREMGLIGEDVSIAEFEDALREIAEPIFGRTLGEISIAALLMKLINTARRFDMRLQPNLLLLQKSMVIIEGVGRQLYPEINMWEVAKPLIYKWMIKERLAPKTIANKTLGRFEEIMGAALEIPVNLNAALKKAVRGDVSVHFVNERLETLPGEVRTAGRRVSTALIAGSAVIASSLIALLSETDAVYFLGLPVLSWIGFLIALILSLRSLNTSRGERD